MTVFLKQSTAATIKLGPFVDITDGATPEEGLTIAQADIRLSKNGGDFAQTNSVTGATHDENGFYGVPLDTTDTGTLGNLRVAVNETAVDGAASLPVWQDFQVVTANVWDTLCSTDRLQAETYPVQQANGGVLKKSTATSIVVGPFISRTTGLPLTSFTVGDITCSCIKNVTNSDLTLTASGGNNDFAHVAGGYWKLELTSTNTDTLGPILVGFQDDDVFIPVTYRAMVVTANVYDSDHSTDIRQADITQILGVAATADANDLLDVNVAAISEDTDAADSLEGAIDNTNDVVAADVTRISGDSGAADNLETACDGGSYNVGGGGICADMCKVSGDSTAADRLERNLEGCTAGAAAAGTLSTTEMTTDLTNANNDHYNGKVVTWTGNTTAALAGISREITDYDGATKKLTFAALHTAPSAGDEFSIT